MARYKPRTGNHWYDVLTNLRCEAGISRAELAASCGVSPGWIAEIERGSKGIPQHVLNQYGRLAESLRKTP
jgi:transcriptional regulator with XRE-family HTH domain